MPKGTDYYADSSGRLTSRVVGQDEEALVKGKAQDASGLGSKVKSSAFVPPRMEPNEDSAKYSARVAKAREAWNQRRAMAK